MHESSIRDTIINAQLTKSTADMTTMMHGCMSWAHGSVMSSRVKSRPSVQGPLGRALGLGLSQLQKHDEDSLAWLANNVAAVTATGAKQWCSNFLCTITTNPCIEDSAQHLI